MPAAHPLDLLSRFLPLNARGRQRGFRVVAVDKGGADDLNNLLQACISSGFFYISDHGVPQQVIDDAFGQAKKFFAQPMDKKMLVDLHKGTSFKGYAGLKGENVDPANRGDVHEAVRLRASFRVLNVVTSPG